MKPKNFPERRNLRRKAALDSLEKRIAHNNGRDCGEKQRKKVLRRKEWPATEDQKEAYERAIENGIRQSAAEHFVLTQRIQPSRRMERSKVRRESRT